MISEFKKEELEAVHRVVDWRKLTKRQRLLQRLGRTLLAYQADVLGVDVTCACCKEPYPCRTLRILGYSSGVRAWNPRMP